MEERRMNSGDRDAINTLIAFKLALDRAETEKLDALLSHIEQLFPESDSPWQSLLLHIRQSNSQWQSLLEAVESKAPTRAAAAVLLDAFPEADSASIEEMYALVDRVVRAYLYEVGVCAAKKSAEVRKNEAAQRRAMWEELRAHGKPKNVCDEKVALASGMKSKSIANARSMSKSDGRPWRGDN
jgi:hypothetical protein